jgi:hypothetical protein
MLHIEIDSALEKRGQATVGKGRMEGAVAVLERIDFGERHGPAVDQQVALASPTCISSAWNSTHDDRVSARGGMYLYSSAEELRRVLLLNVQLFDIRPHILTVPCPMTMESSVMVQFGPKRVRVPLIASLSSKHHHVNSLDWAGVSGIAPP